MTGKQQVSGGEIFVACGPAGAIGQYNAIKAIAQRCLDAVPPAQTWGTLLEVHPLCTRLVIDRALGAVLDDRVHRVHHRCFRPGVPGPHSGRPRRVVYGKKNG